MRSRPRSGLLSEPASSDAEPAQAGSAAARHRHHPQGVRRSARMGYSRRSVCPIRSCRSCKRRPARSGLALTWRSATRISGLSVANGWCASPWPDSRSHYGPTKIGVHCGGTASVALARWLKVEEPPTGEFATSRLTEDYDPLICPGERPGLHPLQTDWRLLMRPYAARNARARLRGGAPRRG